MTVPAAPLGEDDLRKLRHDLRTPLTVVAGFAEVLAEDREIPPAVRRDYAERIHAAAQEIKALVDALLDDGGQAA